VIKLVEIAQQVIKEGGKAFGDRAKRMTTSEMHVVFNELKDKIGKYFGKFEIAKSLPSKESHGDLDIVTLNDKGLNIFEFLKQQYGDAIEDTLKSGNVNSFLFRSQSLGKSVHVDILTTGSEEDFNPQYEYLSYGDFSGILGVMSRRLRYNYGTLGFFKIFEDKRKQYHYILITKDLREGLKILGFESVMGEFDNIQTNDDVVKFISSSPLFDSDYYKNMMLNNSDRKRCRIGRKSADEIRNKLSSMNKHRSIEDNDHFLKKLYPNYYKNLQREIEKIENVVVITKKYTGDWILQNFPQIKPGKVINQIKTYWKSLYNDNIDGVPEETLKQVTQNYINSLK